MNKIVKKLAGANIDIDLTVTDNFYGNRQNVRGMNWRTLLYINVQ